jgi:hypothetical protein
LPAEQIAAIDGGLMSRHIDERELVMKAMRAAVVVLVLVAIASGCGSPASVSMPPISSPPDAVLATYLRALVVGDCSTASALSTPAAGSRVWCNSPHVTSFSALDEGASPSAGERVYATQIVVEGTDMSLGDGEHTWFYRLVRQADATWRIADHGSGP